MSEVKSIEQTTAIIEATGEAINNATMHAEPNMNFWPLLLIGVVPVILGFFLDRHAQKNNKLWRKKK